METKTIENYLKSFGKQVVNRSKSSIGKEKGGKTKLAQSIRFEVTPSDNGFTVKFYMADYGTFLDKGVSGNKITRSFKNQENQLETSPYSYTTKGPPIDIISKWIKMKGIKPKGFKRGRSKKTGQYISGFAYLISRKIKRDGIKSLSFFQKPLRLGMKEFGNKLLNSIKTDIIDSLRVTQIQSVKVN
tara:strand:+ start:13 stop:573 length:561 start_codon:yes stop_codon:yes gene_type:complete